MRETTHSAPPAAPPVSPEALPSLQALVCAAGPPEQRRPILISTNEVFCGPDARTLREEGRFRSLRCAPGAYDLRHVLDRLPAGQRPELLLVAADAARRNRPRQLDALACPKVLLVGDTDHGPTPIGELLRYARAERFDHVVLTRGRQHAHFFVEAGFPSVHWIPGFDLWPHEQPPRAETVTDQIAFTGPVDDAHPYRRHLFQLLERAGLPLRLNAASPDQAAATSAGSLINVHCSRNGELALAVFEVLASGGFLLTDRLAPEAGLDRLFRDGEHLVHYDGPGDLADKIAHYRARPDDARRIARAGHAQWLARHRPIQKIEAMMALLAARPDRLDRLEGSGPEGAAGAGGVALDARVAIYETLQELHRTHLAPHVLCVRGTSAELIADAAGLPRLQLMVEEGPDRDAVARALATRGTTTEAIAFVGDAELASGRARIDVLVAATSEGAMSRWIDQAETVILETGDGGSAMETERRLGERGFQRISAPAPIYVLADRVVIGERAFGAGDPRKAIAHFEAALAADPENVRALNNLGVASDLLGDRRLSRQFLTRALGIDRCNPETLLNLAEAHRAGGDLGEAARLISFLDRRPPASPALGERLSTLRETLPRAAAPAPAATISRRRILVVSNLFPPQALGGHARMLEALVLALRARGHLVRVLTSDTPSLGAAGPADPTVTRTLALFGGWREGRPFAIPPEEIPAVIRGNVAALEATLADFAPDQCLLGDLHFLGTDCLVTLLARGLPVLQHLGDQLPGYPPGDTPQNPLYRAVAASRWVGARVVAAGFPLGDVGAVYPGAPLADFAMPVPPSRQRLKIVCAGPVTPARSTHVLVDALMQLARSRDAGKSPVDFTCTITGESTHPAYLAILRQVIRDVQLESRVHFAGALDRGQLAQLFGGSNVLVFPAPDDQPFETVRQEAMAAGLLVVASAAGGAAEIVEPEVSGLLFPPGDSAALADALAGLVADPARWQRLAQNGQERAHERFDLDRTVDELERQLGAVGAR